MTWQPCCVRAETEKWRKLRSLAVSQDDLSLFISFLAITWLFVQPSKNRWGEKRKELLPGKWKEDFGEVWVLWF